MRRPSLRIRGKLLAALATCAVAGGAIATAQSITPDLKAEYDRAFQATIADPASLDKSLKFAIIAGRAGDLEGAIGALERMLIFNPDLPRVRLELGVLYYRLGSFEVARSYLERAKESKDMPADVARQVDAFLGEIKDRTSHHKFGGTFMSGMRYQWNASVGPNSGQVRIFGLDAIQTGNGVRKADGNIFALANLNYVYNPQDDSGITVEANLLNYAAEQIRLGRLNLTLNRLDVGPRFKLDSLLDGATIRPYALTSLVTLDRSRYYGGGGAGVQIGLPLTAELYAEIEGQGEYKDYRPTSKRPLVNNKDGFDTDLKATLRYALSKSMLAGITGNIGRSFAEAAWERVDQYGIGAEWSWRFDSPLPGNDHPWTLGASTSYTWKYNEKPDPVVDPGIKRHDTEWTVGSTLQVGLSEEISLVLQAQYIKSDSNLPNFRYTNKLGFGAVAVRF